MKRLLIPALLIGTFAITLSAHAAIMNGKILSKQNEKIQVANNENATPTTLKTTPNTTYFIKKKITTEDMNTPENLPDTNDFVEIIYSIDPATNELIIDEIVIIED